MRKLNIVSVEILLIVLIFVSIALLVSILLAKNHLQDGKLSIESDSFNVLDSDSPVTEHKCRFTVTLIAPTCTKEGYKKYVCECGLTDTEVYADKLDHVYKEKAKLEATCTDEGFIEYLCMCGDTYKRTLDKLDHVYEKEEISATCSEDGYNLYTCACGDTYSEICAEKLPHNYIETAVTPATCATEGYVEYICDCGAMSKTVLEKLAHTYKVEETAPSCTTAGYKQYICECGYTYSEMLSDKIAHEYKESSKLDATCTSEGYIDYLCACGETYREVLGKAGHIYKVNNVPATCTSEGSKTYTCSCGYSYTVILDAKGHSFDTKVTKPTCILDGYTIYTCSCGYKYKGEQTRATGHKWSKWTVSKEATTQKCGEQYRKCSSCAKTETEIIEMKKAIDLDSIAKVSMFEGVNPKAMKAINAVLGCIDEYYDTNNNEEIYLGIFELTWIDVSTVESAIAFYLGSYYDGLKSTTFYYIDDNHQHLFVDMSVMRKTEKARRLMMATLTEELSHFEAGDKEYLVNQVFDFLATNISYDRKQSDATVALKSGKGSCNTYPVLFKLMLCELGIPCDICIGYAYTGAYHAWNRVAFNKGEYKYYDLTFYISTNSNKYFAGSSLKHDLVAIDRYLTTKEQQGK